MEVCLFCWNSWLHCKSVVLGCFLWCRFVWLLTFLHTSIPAYVYVHIYYIGQCFAVDAVCNSEIIGIWWDFCRSSWDQTGFSVCRTHPGVRHQCKPKKSSSFLMLSMRALERLVQKGKKSWMNSWASLEEDMRKRGREASQTTLVAVVHSRLPILFMKFYAIANAYGRSLQL